jgi:hypothetical protein
MTETALGFSNRRRVNRHMSSNLDVIDRFTQRPTLRETAVKQLRIALQAQFPDLEIDPEICVITRITPGGEQRSDSLLRNLQQAINSGKTPRLRNEANTLLLNPAAEGAVPTPVDFDQLNVLLDAVALDLGEHFQRALVEFWSTADADGRSPWACMSAALARNLSSAAAAPEIREDSRAFLRAVAEFPDKTQRDFMLRITEEGANAVIHASIPCVATGDDCDDVALPMLTATGFWGGNEQFFAWKPAGRVSGYSSLIELTSSLLAAQPVPSGASLKLPEPEGSLFEALAQMILERQLHAIARASDAAADFADLEHRLAAATDIAPYLLPPLVQPEHRDPLPDWLQAAGPTDRQDFSRRLIALASAQARAGGRRFNDDLPSLLVYAEQQLQRALLADHPQDTHVQIADLDVLIEQVVAVAIPSGGQVVAMGTVEPVRISVAEFALENLSAQPAGPLRVVHRSGSPAPDWFSADYLRLLVCQVDIGRTYPALVSRYLVTDPLEAGRRQALYIDQLRTQLPLRALELKTRTGRQFGARAYALVGALMQDPSQRPPGLRDTTLRPLAFRATAGATADHAANMFVIADRDTAKGPVVLYRPVSQQPLTAFISWEALRTAIVQPGELQDEVLTWMSDHARQRYANGGFDQPHIVRFGQGSEFAPLEIPSPAQWALDEVAGDPLIALFMADAAALVELADRNSTSNAESRWALLKRGGWLTLDSVMPFISGPLGNALWLVQLLTQARGALSAGSAAQGSEAGESLGNLLLTAAMLLLHIGLGDGLASMRNNGRPFGRGRTAVPARAKLAELLSSTDSKPEPEPEPVSPVPDRQKALLDFRWSRLDQTLSDAQKASLALFRVLPEPALAEPSGAGFTEGLYEFHGHWYARVDDAVYQVLLDDQEVLVIDPNDPQNIGPRLVRQGHRWDLDLRLRLRGGGPKRNARQLAAENAARLKHVTTEKIELLDRQTALYSRIVANDDRLDGLPIEQHPAVIAEMEADIRSVVEIVDRKNELDQQLRPADRASDKSYAKDLQGVVRRICLLEGVLLSDMLRLAKEDLANLQALSTTVTAQNVELYRALFEKTLRLQNIGVYWSSIRETLWQRMRDVPKVGDEYWRKESLELYNSRMFAHVEWRAARMWSSLELCFSVEVILDGSSAVTLKRLLNDGSLHAALTSQAELEKPNDYMLVEQIGVLESSLREYDRASMVALAAFEGEPEALDTGHFQGFIDDLSAISDRAEHRLSDLIRESEEPADTPAEYVPRLAQTRKRVIKTRGQRTLIGRVREGEEPLLGEVVEVKAAIGDRVIGSYHQHAEGEWVELEDQRPGLTTRESIVPLAELMRRGRALLERVGPDIANAVRQSRRASEPEDMEDILCLKADKIGELAAKLQAYTDEPKSEEGDIQRLQVLLADLRAAESRLREQGRSLRIEMIKRQPPTASRISYLDRQREVNIARIDGRKNMSGSRRNDFVQEYVIRDRDDHVLWWAHFHYATEDAPPNAFAAAHLKLPAQRLTGYKALLKAARDNKEVVSVYRSAIGKEPAQRLFLHLAD